MLEDFDILSEFFVVEDDSSWRNNAACSGKDTSLWFPNDKSPFAVAKKICSTCEVKEQCLDYAIVNDIKFGIWGGLTANARRKIHRELRT